YANNDGNVQGAVINNVSGNTHFGILGTSSEPASANYTKNDDGSYTLVIKLTNGRSITYPTVNMAAGYAPPAQTTIVTDGTTGWLIEDTTPAACFLTGVKLRTVSGDVSVEDIRKGDMLLVQHDGRECEKPVVWVGKNRKIVSAGLPDDEAGYPVRVLKDALAEGVPYQDMLVTSEHCLLMDGRFVPVRMLVNGTSIFYDRTLTTYEYYHVETEDHSVLVADGVLTESYLDTGNRSSFVSDSNVVSLHSRGKTWAADAAAPLEVRADFVEPLFRALAERAGVVAGTAPEAQGRHLTQDAELSLLTEAGSLIRPVRQTKGQMVSFMVPAGVSTVRLVSRASRPCDVIGPFV
ncbi:Hint domain-containing protein, partial [Acetobacter tropicalis]